MRQALILALLLIAGCAGSESVAQKPPPEPLRWLVLRPPPVELVTFTCTAPRESNFGTCEAPALRAHGVTMTVRWRWVGPAPGAAFVMAAPGDTVRIAVPASAETLTVTTERFGRSCGDTSVVVRP